MSLTRYEAKYMNASTNTLRAESEISLHERIRKARGKLAAMAGTYFIGVFNDNFFKQTALLMAVAAGKSELQSFAAAIFTLPFILFAAQAGWCADRFSKRSVVISAKLFELLAMIFGALGVLYGNWTLILVMLGIEGLQATMFSPALNGSIPELYPAEYVITANAIIKMISTAAILAGMAAAGPVLDLKGYFGSWQLNHAAASMVVIGISVCGVLISFGVPKFAAASPKASFPWRGPTATIKVLYELRLDSLLAVTILANTFFWFIGALEVLVLNQLGITQFGFTNTITSALSVAELVGIAAGGLLSIYLAKKFKWYRLLAPVAVVMAVCMLAVAFIPYLHGYTKLICLFAVLVSMGVAGGVFVIPLESFIQVRPAADRKGATIAAANFAAFSGIFLASGVLYVLDKLQNSPSNDFGIMAAMAAAAAVLIFVFLRGCKE
jgi:acyl-[acyl-carrier-protein]-phospholipid O-acyltransferase/long-chain-fatty-acid--[acyl-carrier-protein] ligase